jgi:hypothetical protein
MLIKKYFCCMSFSKQQYFILALKEKLSLEKEFACHNSITYNSLENIFVIAML